MIRQPSTTGLIFALVWIISIPVLAQDQGKGFATDEQKDRLVITHAGKPVAAFVFQDEKILRPYFTAVHAPGGFQVTRNHPPVSGIDEIDHDTIHPGIWLGFGDISGHDFWRNKGRIEHIRFSEPPAVKDDHLTFATESRLLTADNRLLCQLTSRFMLASRPQGTLLVWDAAFRSNDSDFTFGDQEEMGFGARVATSLTEKNGGIIVNSKGLQKAETTWGQPASWCDYSKAVDGRITGITLMASPANFRDSWWHNRNYGVFIANPFGRLAMKQGEKSMITVKQGETFRLKFAAVLHDATDYDPAMAYTDFLEFKE